MCNRKDFLKDDDQANIMELYNKLSKLEMEVELLRQEVANMKKTDAVSTLDV